MVHERVDGYYDMDRSIPVISLKAFAERKAEIQQQLVEAAETAGFFTLEDHGLFIQDIEAQFQIARNFFDLLYETKQQASPFEKTKNTGYEYKGQIRPSTGKADEKESIQLQLIRKDYNWPNLSNIPDFKSATAEFMNKCHTIAMQVCELFLSFLSKRR